MEVAPRVQPSTRRDSLNIFAKLFDQTQKHPLIRQLVEKHAGQIEIIRPGLTETISTCKYYAQSPSHTLHFTFRTKPPTSLGVIGYARLGDVEVSIIVEDDSLRYEIHGDEGNLLKAQAFDEITIYSPEQIEEGSKTWRGFESLLRYKFPDDFAETMQARAASYTAEHFDLESMHRMETLECDDVRFKRIGYINDGMGWYLCVRNGQYYSCYHEQYGVKHLPMSLNEILDLAKVDVEALSDNDLV